MAKKLDDYYDSQSSKRQYWPAPRERRGNQNFASGNIYQRVLGQAKKRPGGKQFYDIRYMLDYSIFDSNEGYSYIRTDLEKDGRRFRSFDILGYEKLIVVGAYR